MSYTTANEEGPSWMNRLPRISSQSKSMSKMSDTDLEDIKMEDLHRGRFHLLAFQELSLDGKRKKIRANQMFGVHLSYLGEGRSPNGTDTDQEALSASLLSRHSLATKAKTHLQP
ncbi:hypothetical protein VC83_07998 [Pseudogymnoascus destructans]|uniref:Alkali metal cation/H+ antiporter Nha1 C-terminal domain-containing protein n=1 Tax=Pseudogymnoascus destructans TaxID=655981 RepID=A0A177A182_9PEZI|nr:uncharacterized protein VC83_07998 [Pseudogymnoascus destructans]OAF56029.1 hypothetical protein VC83_07998 [Pseudogymnoascus destructans]